MHDGENMSFKHFTEQLTILWQSNHSHKKQKLTTFRVKVCAASTNRQRSVFIGGFTALFISVVNKQL